MCLKQFSNYSTYSILIYVLFFLNIHESIYVTMQVCENSAQSVRKNSFFCHNSHLSFSNAAKLASHMQKFMEDLLKLTE